jgi:parallel beta-helix repeat protein
MKTNSLVLRTAAPAGASQCRHRRLLRGASAGFCLVALCASPLRAQGPLTPPGAPAPTMKTLDQIEPRKPIDAANTPGDGSSVFRITASGSYYLTAPLTGVSGKSGIVIGASQVTVDLGGFPLTGIGGAASGILVESGSNHVSISHGSVVGWGSGGIDAVDSQGSAFTDLEAVANTFDGLRLGPDSTVRNCKSRDNGVHGFSVNGQATILGCTSDNNGTSGFVIGTGVVSDSLASNNGAHGFASRGASFSHCLSHDNVGDGYYDAVNLAVVAGAAPALAPGVGDQSAGSYFDCVANANGSYGFEITASGMNVNACTANSNASPGISVGGGSTVTNCIVSNGSSDGITVGDGSTVTGCTSRNNVTGIFASGSACRIADNQCDGNYWGIIAYGERLHIEGNHCTNSGKGIYLTAQNNLVIRNSVADSSEANYDIVANNKVGVIVSAPNSGAIMGSTGGAGVGTTDPWANFSY